jgi:hypothetical protein
MATSLQEIAELLFEAEYKFKINNERSEIFLQMGGLDNYRDKDGDDSLLIVVRVSEEGEYLEIFAPGSFVIPEDGEKAALFLKACSIIQWKTKLVQFEYDESDGEIRPMVEFPIEDSTVTQKQLMRCIRGLTQLVDTYSPVLNNVKENGTLDFDAMEKKDDLNRMMDAINNLPVEALEELLRRKKQI